MDSTEKIRIRAPNFELYQSVILSWNSQESPTHIVRRWFDLDNPADGYRWYKVINNEQLYPEQAIEPHNE